MARRKLLTGTPGISTGAVKVGDKVYVGDRLQGGVKVYRLIEREGTTEFSPTDEQYALGDVGCLSMDENGAVYILDGTTVKTLSPPLLNSALIWSFWTL